jgi:hypothetical protein
MVHTVTDETLELPGVSQDKVTEIFEIISDELTRLFKVLELHLQNF